MWVKAAPLYDSNGNLIGAIESIRDITEHKQAEDALRKRTQEFSERGKELYCLSNLAGQQGISLDEILQGIVDIIPSAWQYPESTCARVILEGQIIRTNNFEETNWKQACDIFIDGKQLGTLEVCYLEERTESDEGPFLKEERNLINAIAERLETIIKRKQIEEELRKHHDLLEDLVEERTKELIKVNTQLQREIIEHR